MSYCEQARKFSQGAYPDQCRDTPTEMSKGTVAFIRRMVNDELDELGEATNVVDQADALVDMIYYVCNVASKHGINLDPLYSIVHRANMRKAGPDGKFVVREDGKILKVEGWVGPESEIAEELNHQREEGAFQ